MGLTGRQRIGMLHVCRPRTPGEVPVKEHTTRPCVALVGETRGWWGIDVDESLASSPVQEVKSPVRRRQGRQAYVWPAGRSQSRTLASRGRTCFAPGAPSHFGPCLFSKILQKFSRFFITLNITHMHKILNIDKNNN